LFIEVSHVRPASTKTFDESTFDASFIYRWDALKSSDRKSQKTVRYSASKSNLSGQHRPETATSGGRCRWSSIGFAQGSLRAPRSNQKKTPEQNHYVFGYRWDALESSDRVSQKTVRYSASKSNLSGQHRPETATSGGRCRWSSIGFAQGSLRAPRSNQKKTPEQNHYVFGYRWDALESSDRERVLIKFYLFRYNIYGGIQ